MSHRLTAAQERIAREAFVSVYKRPLLVKEDGLWSLYECIAARRNGGDPLVHHCETPEAAWDLAWYRNRNLLPHRSELTTSRPIRKPAP